MIPANNELTPQTPTIAQEIPAPSARPTALASPPLDRPLSIPLENLESSVPAEIPGNNTSPSDPALPIQFITAPVESFQNPRPCRPRNGKIAHLPKLEREMVNRMLANNLPQEKIADALGERGFNVTQRNVSNWKNRGGYKEWCAAQARALELRTFQDTLTGFLRRHDAAELSEVGLQSAATNISAILLRPDLMRELLASPEKYSKLIELQCRIARELQGLQEKRDDASRSIFSNPERRKRTEENEVERIRECFSSKAGKSVYDRNIPHRNFIPKELDLVPSPTKQPNLDLLRQLAQARLAQTPAKT